MGTMKDKPEFSELRQRAEKKLEIATGRTEAFSEMSTEKTASLIHELEVHQIELEMQNHELRSTRDELEKARDRYSHLYDFAPIGYFTVNQKGVIHEANLTIAAMLGVERGGLIGQPFTRFVLRDDQDVFYEHRQRLLEKESPQSFELSLVRNDGRVFYARLECTIITSKGDNLKQIRIAASDVSKRRKAEEALRESEKKYKTLIEAIPDMVWEFDENEIFTFCSQSYIEILGYEPLELVGKSVYSIMPSAEADKIRLEFQKFKRERRPFKGLVNLNLTKQGNPRWLLSSAVPIIDDHGNYKGYRGIDKDVTELKEAEEERKKLEDYLIQAHKMEAIATLTGGIAHDYNNLLTSIIGNLSLAMEEEKGSRLADFLTQANNAAYKVRDLTHELMSLSKGGAPVTELGSLDELLKTVLDIIPTDTGISLNESIPQDLKPVAYDRYKMGSVFRNVLTNAVEAMPNGGILKIKAENMRIDVDSHGSGLPMKPGDYVHISFHDEGVGIPGEHLEKLFDPYFSTKAMGVQKGMGLGLATSYAIIQKHEGHIAIDSTLGVGTTVNIYLPTERQPTKIDSTNLTAENSAFPMKRVLVMDDEEMLRKLAQEILERMGYAVETVKDGLEAIEAYQNQKACGKPFDAVILDLTIKGGMGGQQAIRELLKIDPDVKAIVYSGYSNDPVMAKYKKHGFRGAMAKPFDKETLKEVLEKLFE